MTLDPDHVKACCAAGYSGDLVELLLGDSYHPGGLALSRRLLDGLDLEAGDRLADVASGRGTTALLAATAYGAEVDGVDLASANVALAAGTAAAHGLEDRARFHHGDAEALPLPDAAYDAALCECALCTFPDKAAAVREMARVLRPGGRLGIADVTADRGRLPEVVTGLWARIACIADACSRVEYEALLVTAGLRVTLVAPQPAALERMILQVAARTELLRMTDRARAEQAGLDFGRVPELISVAQDAVEAGTLGYVLIVAEKPS